MKSRRTATSPVLGGARSTSHKQDSPPPPVPQIPQDLDVFQQDGNLKGNLSSPPTITSASSASVSTSAASPVRSGTAGTTASSTAVGATGREGENNANGAGGNANVGLTVGDEAGRKLGIDRAATPTFLESSSAESNDSFLDVQTRALSRDAEKESDLNRTEDGSDALGGFGGLGSSANLLSTHSALTTALNSSSAPQRPSASTTASSALGSQGYFDPTFKIRPQADTAHITTAPGSTAPVNSPAALPITIPQSNEVSAARAAMYSHVRQRSNPTPLGTSPMDGKANILSSAASVVAMHGTSTPPQQGSPVIPPKDKSKSKTKLFSKSKDKEKPDRIGTPPTDKVKRPIPSPSKGGMSHITTPIPRIVGVHDSTPPAPRKGSFGSSNATLVGSMDGGLGLPQPLFAQAGAASGVYSSSPPLSSGVSIAEGKIKEHSHKSHFLRPRKDPHTLTLSSASSNSKLINADAASIYSFGPSSPSTAVFTQHKSDGSSSYKHPNLASSSGGEYIGITQDDWAIVRQQILTLFQSGIMRTTVEEMNLFVMSHIRKCLFKSSSVTLLDDVRDVLDSGMLTLDPILRSCEEDQLVTRLIEVWMYVLGTILPYVEAVFLPLQQEMKGVGGIMNAREARDFWGETGEDVGDVRRMALMSFRDCVVLPIAGRLRTLFSTLTHSLSSSPNITQTVARVLQCISVIQSILSHDDAQAKIDELAKSLKHNWLSRGRKGGNRRGFVGFKMKIVQGNDVEGEVGRAV